MDVPDLHRLAEDVGAKSFRVQPFFSVGRGSQHRAELDFIPEMTKEVTSFFVEAAKRSGIELGGFYFQFVLDPDVKTVDQPCEDGSCSAGYSFAGVTHDGYVYPCSHIWQLAEDNVRQRPLPWIWENSQLFNFFRSLRREDVNELCQGCIYFEVQGRVQGHEHTGRAILRAGQPLLARRLILPRDGTGTGNPGQASIGYAPPLLQVFL